MTAWRQADTAAVGDRTGGMPEPGSTGFLPWRHGFAFTNSWPPAPAVEIPTRLGTLGIGNAARGLCGGMVFAAWPVRGFFRAAYSPADPPDL